LTQLKGQECPVMVTHACVCLVIQLQFLDALANHSVMFPAQWGAQLHPPP